MTREEVQQALQGLVEEVLDQQDRGYAVDVEEQIDDLTDRLVDAGLASEPGP